MNILQGILQQSEQGYRVVLDEEHFLPLDVQDDLYGYIGKSIKIGIRPEDIRVLRDSDSLEASEHLMMSIASVVESLGAGTLFLPT